jgi:hypothetical protein
VLPGRCCQSSCPPVARQLPVNLIDHYRLRDELLYAPAAATRTQNRVFLLLKAGMNDATRR